MGLSPGTRLGPYEIAAQLGAGGMGEVYRARDTRLGRDVAIKVLPPGGTFAPEARARFEREARLVSQLNHPNICTLHDVGREGETDYLVMELIKGGSLQERLALKTALPLEEVFALGIEIADALDAAHSRGIVHRDLKPGNVLLTERGHAKVMDFGLALRARRGARAPGMSSVSSGASTEAEEHLTSPGLAVGTVAYMSPEQARGEEVDARSDLFSLGAVLYEMASGHRAFAGDATAVIFEAILNRMPPPASMLKPELPRELDRILEKALEKDRELRYQSAAEVRSDLKRLRRDVDSGRSAGTGTAAAGRPQSNSREAPAVVISASAQARRRLTRFAWGAAAVVGLAGVALLATQLARRTPPGQSVRLSIEAPVGVSAISAPAISPDGRYLAFVGDDSLEVRRIYVRPLDAPVARSLPGTEGVVRPFWSPDSRSIGFFAYGGKLKRVEVTGGQPTTIHEGEIGDGTWGASGTILVDHEGTDPIRAINASGGEATQATWLDKSRGETGHVWPEFLPDGRHFLYLAKIAGKADSTALRVGRLGSKDSKVLAVGSFSRVRYVAPGYILYARERTLLAQPFDAGGQRLTGDALPVVDDILRGGDDAFTASATGSLVYFDEIADVYNGRLAWTDRAGKEIGSLGSVARYGYGLALSPDERRLAVSMIVPGESTSDIWLLDVTRDVATRFTSDPGSDIGPVWSPDGATIYFSSFRGGRDSRVWVKPSGGTSGEHELAMPPGVANAHAVTPDGRYLLASMCPVGSGKWDIVTVTLGVTPRTTAIGIQPEALGTGNLSHSLSPDGKWLAYVSGESGRNEIYVVDFPGLRGKWRISTDGGIYPRWSRNGNEIFFTAPNYTLRAVSVTTVPSFHAGTPVRALPQVPEVWQYAPSSDGRRFLVLVPAKGQSLPPFRVVLNWPAGLRRG